MQKTSKLLGSVFAVCAAMGFICDNANAAGRSMAGASNGATTGRAAMATNTMRMPTMPTMSINTIGTVAVSGVETPTGNSGYVPVNPNPNPNPEPTPTPATNCPDGLAPDSDFTVENCMDSILACVQSGVLPNGLNDLFNEDLRNSIFNGMGICASQVDACIRQVRLNCHPVYDSAQDVWIDFNSRKVQPAYFDFVLRKTGLTPNQAENVCQLLDKNTYGKSFAAVSGTDNVTSEYNQKVGAYNEQNGGSLSKANPVGATVNTTANGNNGVDGERGHYARWDATNAVCKIRVAAYNKDTLITNSWLFGAVGDDKAAEVWQDAGSTFTCSKDLFDFSLLNDTKTVAVVGMGGGTLVGAGIGALTGHGARDFSCDIDSMREDLFDQIKKAKLEVKLSAYLDKNIPLSKEDFTSTECDKIANLYDEYVSLSGAVENCSGLQYSTSCQIRLTDASGKELVSHEFKNDCGALNNFLDNAARGAVVVAGKTYTGVDQASLQTAVNNLAQCKSVCDKTNGSLKESCNFKSLVKTEKLSNMLCSGSVGDCNSKENAQKQVDALNAIFGKLTIMKGEKSNVAKNAVIGGAIGLGAGGVATAVAALVEKNNISCHVGDGLNTVGFGKSFTIDSLKDFYVKWALHVADSISPTARVTSCQDWIDTCGMYTTAAECANVEINYQRPGRNTTTLVRGACRMSGSVCIENRPVAVSYGACTRNGVVPQPTPVNPGSNPQIIQH